MISSGVSAVAAAPSFDSLRELLGNVYTSHLVYARKRAVVMFDEEGDTSSMNQSTCPITFDNSTFDAVSICYIKLLSAIHERIRKIKLLFIN